MFAVRDENGTLSGSTYGNGIEANYEGCTATFDIEVYFTFWQWLLYIICFGWIWM